MSVKKNILILSFFFPPCNKVGGRRWAKFAKYLHRLNYGVYVIAIDYPYYKNCPWEKDVLVYKENIYRIPYIEHRPFYLVNKSPENLIDKVRYRLSWYKEKIVPTQYSEDPIDISEKYNDNLLQISKRIILEKKIDTVIVTGGPFRWCYESLKIKQSFPDLNFVLDLRDFWTGGYSYERMDESTKMRENFREKECIKAANIITTPAERIAIHLRNKYPQFSNRIIHIPHAYDAEELNALMNYKMQEKTITFAYGGVFYSHMEEAIGKLILLLQKIKSKGISVKFDVYTFDNAYEHLFKSAGLEKEIHYHKTLPPSELFAILSRTDYLLQLRAGEAQEQHFKSTKFYELIALRRPIIYFGPTSDIEDFLLENHLGFSGNAPTETLIKQIINNKEEQKIPDKNFDISTFEYLKVTYELEKYL